MSLEERITGLIKEASLLQSKGKNFLNVISILKDRGASQMECSLVLVKVFNFSLKDADELIQNSELWADLKDGNIFTRREFFKDEGQEDEKSK